MQPGVPVLLAVDHPLVAVADRRGLHPGGVGAVQRLGHPEPMRAVPSSIFGIHSACWLGAELSIIRTVDEVADDRALVLQVVVQPEARAGEVLADDRHVEVAAVLTAEALGQW